MLESKVFEIRDAATFIPALAIKVDPNTVSDQERWLLRRAGYGSAQPVILLVHLSKPECQYDPYGWPDASWVRTMPAAHLDIEKRFHELEPGAVVDVRVHLGEATEPAPSERGW